MSISLNKYAVRLLTNTEVNHIKQNNYNYFLIPDRSQYKLKLTNNRETRCDAEIFIDGESVGKWRINPYSTITIERPANINRKFMFMTEKKGYPLNKKYFSIEKKLFHSDYCFGLITVVFKPEFFTSCMTRSSPYIATPTFYNEDMVSWSDVTPIYKTDYTMNAGSEYTGSAGSVKKSSHIFLNNDIYPTGKTILGGGTDQEFNPIAKLQTVDKNNITIINFRLLPNMKQPYMTVSDLNKPNPSKPTKNNIELVNEVRNRFYNNDKIMIQRPYD